MRLNRFLSIAGVCSRRQADELIKAGRVKYNGHTVREMGVIIDPTKDTVEVDGKPVKAIENTVIYLLNKPKGVVTTAHDPEGRKTVLDLVPKSPRVFPCGRLDNDTMGLVLLTNDGNLCYQLTHPKFEHIKEYIVEGRCTHPQQAVEKLLKGVKLADGMARADAIQILKASGNKIRMTITVHEGRNRLVRRMCAAVDIELENLTRTRLGDYLLGDLLPGKFRKL